MRWFTDESEKILKKRLDDICKGIEIVHDVKIKLKYHEYGYPATVNHKIGYKNVCNAARKIVGINGLDDNCISATGSEDFSYFLNLKPGAFFWLGAKKQHQTEQYFHHQSKFKLDQRCLVIGCNIFVQIVNDLLINPKNSKL